MTAFADYTFYQQSYLCGRTAAIPQSSFPYYANRAGAVIRQYTLGNIGEEIPESVSMCCCELAELTYAAENSKSAQGVASEKVGDWSVGYENADSLRQSLPKRMKSVVYSRLADTGLLHRGGDLC